MFIQNNASDVAVTGVFGNFPKFVFERNLEEIGDYMGQENRLFLTTALHPCSFCSWTSLDEGWCENIGINRINSPHFL